MLSCRPPRGWLSPWTPVSAVTALLTAWFQCASAWGWPSDKAPVLSLSCVRLRSEFSWPTGGVEMFRHVWLRACDAWSQRGWSAGPR